MTPYSKWGLQADAHGVVQFSPRDWTLSITRARHSCTVFAAQVEAMYKLNTVAR